MTLLGILPFAHSLLEASVQAGDYAVDCTLGNGYDTAFLAELVGKEGHVYGFDIQEQAITKSSERLKEKQVFDRVTLFQTSHEHLATHIPTEDHTKIKAAIFNLGYLPGGDKSIVTKPSSTLSAIQSLLTFMQRGGLIILVIYPGHDQGKLEKERILTYTESLNQQEAAVLKYEFTNQKNDPPFLICIEKK